MLFSFNFLIRSPKESLGQGLGVPDMKYDKKLKYSIFYKE